VELIDLEIAMAAVACEEVQKDSRACLEVAAKDDDANLVVEGSVAAASSGRNRLRNLLNTWSYR
jgi:hypothetical protein